MSKIYLTVTKSENTLGGGQPVKAYATEALAKKAIEKASDVRRAFSDKLFSFGSIDRGLEYKLKDFPIRGEDGKFYRTKNKANDAVERTKWLASPEGLEMTRQALNAKEYDILELELIEEE